MSWDEGSPWPAGIGLYSGNRLCASLRAPYLQGVQFQFPMTHPLNVAQTQVSLPHRLSAALRAGGAALGLAEFTRAPLLSSTVVAFSVLDGGAIVKVLYEDHGTVIAGSRNRLAGRVIRIGTMGAPTDGTILTDVAHLEAVLCRMGHPITRGAGLVAASVSLAAGN